MLDLGPPEQLNVDALPGEPAEFSLDLPMEFRARIMGMDWIPPVDVRADLGISEADVAKHPQRWESEAVNWRSEAAVLSKPKRPAPPPSKAEELHSGVNPS